MKFLNLANKVMKMVNESKKSDSDGIADNESPKFPIWLLGGGVGCSIFAIAFVFIIIIAVLIHLGIIKVDLSSRPSYGGSLSYESSCNYEETMVTVMDYTGTEVLATVPLEDYIIGVAVFEIGASNGSYSSLSEHYIKTQYIAAKTWLLSTQNYNSSSKTIIVTASTYDQQWCDLNLGCYSVDLTDKVKGLYATYPGGYNGKSATRKLTESDLETARRYYNETYGQLYLSNSYNDVITSLGYDDATYYIDVTQNFWNSSAKNGNSYDKILELTGLSPGKVGVTGRNTDISTYYSGDSIYRLGNYCKVQKSDIKPGISSISYPSGGLQIPSYYQNDYDDVYLSNDGVKTVSSSGCGFTSCAMIVSYLTGETITPREFVDDWSLPYYVYGVGMDFRLPAAAAQHYGLGEVVQTTDSTEMLKALKDGHPVMSSQGPGLFTNSAHLIVLRGVTDDGKILVNDPYKSNAIDKGYNDRKFTLEEIDNTSSMYFIWPK